MIKFPEMREELIERLQLLSDSVYQQAHWGSKSPHLDFRYIVHFFFDDSALAEAPEECIGYILEGEREAVFVDCLCKKLNHVLDVYGHNQPDVFYINTPEWKEVIKDAKDFLVYLTNVDPSIAQHETPQMKFHVSMQNRLDGG
jgi:hypothetical protein